MAELVLHVPDIDESGKNYAFELKPSWLETTLRDANLRPDPQYGPGALSVHAQQNGTEYLVTGSLRAHLVTECGRCLGEARVAVDTTFATLFNRVGGKGAGKVRPSPRETLELDEDDDELEREDFTGNDIPLDELVREHLVLEVPMQPLCSEACQGIALPKHVRPPEDAFGKPGERHVDPRLAPLQRLRDNVPPEPATPAKPPERSNKRSSNKE
jgi:uncharacterized protein